MQENSVLPHHLYVLHPFWSAYTAPNAIRAQTFVCVETVAEPCNWKSSLSNAVQSRLSCNSPPNPTFIPLLIPRRLLSFLLRKQLPWLLLRRYDIRCT
jgi:hypothetical protein